MSREGLVVALGERRFRVERPWGEVPDSPGKVTDVACDAEGRVYVQLRTDPSTDSGTPAIVVLAPDGRRIAAWGGEAVLDGHMASVHPDGRVFVVDRDAHEVIVFDAAGRRLGGIGKRHAPGEPFNAPCDVAFAPDGTIYVADGYANARIHRFSAEGTPIGGWGAPGRGPGEFCTPHSVWVLPDGAVAVADRENHRVQVFAPDGTWLREITDLHKPMDVHGGPDGTLYVTDQVPRLSWFDATTGRLLGRCRPVLNGAHGMWAAPDGALLLAEQTPSRLTRLARIG